MLEGYVGDDPERLFAPGNRIMPTLVTNEQVSRVSKFFRGSGGSVMFMYKICDVYLHYYISYFVHKHHGPSGPPKKIGPF